jgi:ABC-type lipoprotein export system ATPase subunit
VQGAYGGATEGLYDLRHVRRRVPNVSGGADEVTVLDIDRLVLPRGRMIAILGPSGSGKSTLLALLGAMAQPAKPAPQETDARLSFSLMDWARPVDLMASKTRSWRGNLVEFFRFGGFARRAKSVRRHLGFVFQAPYLVSDCTVYLNLALLWDREHGVPPARRIRNICRDLGLIGPAIDRSDIRARRISGGEQQRVGLARALARRPTIVLADEPTAALDPKLGALILEKLSQWRARKPRERTVIWVTHRIDEAAAFADLIVVLQGGHLAPGGGWPRQNPGLGREAVLRGWVDGGDGPHDAAVQRQSFPETVDPAGEPAEPTVAAITQSGNSDLSAGNVRGTMRDMLARAANTLRVVIKSTIAQIFNASTADSRRRPEWLASALSSRKTQQPKKAVWHKLFGLFGIFALAVGFAGLAFAPDRTSLLPYCIAAVCGVSGLAVFLCRRLAAVPGRLMFLLSALGLALGIVGLVAPVWLPFPFAGVIAAAGLAGLALSGWRTIAAFGPKLEFMFLLATLLMVIGISQGIHLVELLKQRNLSDPSINPVVLANPRGKSGAADPISRARQQLVEARIVPAGRHQAPPKGVYDRHISYSLAHRPTTAMATCGDISDAQDKETYPSLVVNLEEPIFDRLEFAPARINDDSSAIAFSKGLAAEYIKGDAKYEESVILSQAMAAKILTENGKDGKFVRDEICVYRAEYPDLQPDEQWVPMKVRAIVREFPRDSLSSSREPFGIIYNERSFRKWAEDATKLSALAAAYFNASNAEHFVEVLDRALGPDRDQDAVESGYTRMREALRMSGTLLTLLKGGMMIFFLLIAIVSALCSLNFLIRNRKAISVLRAFGLTFVRLAVMRLLYTICIITLVTTTATLLVLLFWPWFASWLATIGRIPAMQLDLSLSEIVNLAMMFFLAAFAVDLATIGVRWLKTDLAAELQEVV